MASPGFHDAQALIGKVKLLINAQLKSVLKKAGLPVSGVKAAMQERIIARKLHTTWFEMSIYLNFNILRRERKASS